MIANYRQVYYPQIQRPHDYICSFEFQYRFEFQYSEEIIGKEIGVRLIFRLCWTWGQ